MCSLAINFATRQILEYIEIPEFQRIGISGVNDTRVVSRLRSLQWMRKKFNIIILVNALRCRTVTDIEDSIVSASSLSTSSTQQEVDKLLRNENFLVILSNADFCTGLD